jgi:hypothetical protein
LAQRGLTTKVSKTINAGTAITKVVTNNFVGLSKDCRRL